jgi:primary-amine oxidase
MSRLTLTSFVNTKMYTTGFLLLSASLASASALPPLGYERKLLHDLLDKRQDTGCLGGDAPSVAAPKPNPWAPITPEENTAVWNLLHDETTGLNLTDPADAAVSDNYVFWIDTVHSNKSDILPYIDGDGEAPAKYARAIIFEGAKEEPGSQEYMIGPLPVTNATTVAPLDYMYNGGSGGFVPFNARYHDSAKSRAVEPLVAEVMTTISDITQALFQGAAYYGSSDERTNLTQSVPTPLSFDGTQAIRVILWRFPGRASYLTPLDFYTIFDTPGTDPTHYTLRGFVTNSKFFKTIDDLRSAFDAGELAQQYDQEIDPDWALVDYKPELGMRELEERFAPSSLELGGKRYKIDMEERYVEYMGWSFYLSYSRTLGIMFYDIKFKGERILYELSLQEALAQYSGFTPKAAGTVYHDTYYSLGVDMYTLVEGFDCSFGATFLNVSYNEGNSTTVNPNAICIFEQDSGFPLSRHFYGGGNSSYAFSRLGVTKGAALIIRAIATVSHSGASCIRPTRVAVINSPFFAVRIIPEETDTHLR